MNTKKEPQTIYKTYTIWVNPTTKQTLNKLKEKYHVSISCLVRITMEAYEGFIPPNFYTQFLDPTIQFEDNYRLVIKPKIYTPQETKIFIYAMSNCAYLLANKFKPINTTEIANKEYTKITTLIAKERDDFWNHNAEIHARYKEKKRLDREIGKL